MDILIIIGNPTRLIAQVLAESSAEVIPIDSTKEPSTSTLIMTISSTGKARNIG